MASLQQPADTSLAKSPATDNVDDGVTMNEPPPSGAHESEKHGTLFRNDVMQQHHHSRTPHPQAGRSSMATSALNDSEQVLRHIASIPPERSGSSSQWPRLPPCSGEVLSTTQIRFVSRQDIVLTRILSSDSSALSRRISTSRPSRPSPRRSASPQSSSTSPSPCTWWCKASVRTDSNFLFPPPT